MELLPPTSPRLNPIIHSSGCYLVIQTRYSSPQLWVTNISAPKTGVDSCGLLTGNFPSEKSHCITKTVHFAGSEHTNPYSYLAAEQLHFPKTKLAHLEYNFNAFPTCCHAYTELHMPVHPPISSHTEGTNTNTALLFPAHNSHHTEVILSGETSKERQESDKPLWRDG